MSWFIFNIAMAQSMTGFGSAERDGFRVEIRSLNQRFFDIYIKAPSSLHQLEMDFRNILKEKVSRGKIDVFMSMSEKSSADIKLNIEAAGKIYGELRRLKKEFSIPGDIGIGTLAYFHDLLLESDDSCDVSMVREVFGLAVENLLQMRKTEGRMLVEELGQLTEELSGMNEEVKKLSGKAASDFAGKLNEKVKAVLDDKEMDSNRMMLEIAIIASRHDISEELVRIDSHVIQLREVLEEKGIIGRKLDFIIQELNREVNTIASKSTEYSISKLTVEMKTVIEKMREQVQNLQ